MNSEVTKRPFAVGAIVLAALLLTGCSVSSGQSSADRPGIGAPAPIAPGGVAEDAGGDAIGGDLDPAGRDVITTGSMSVTVDDPIDAAEDAAAIAERAGGRVDDRTENPGTGNQQASATLTLRIPADAFNDSVARLKKLGDVNFVSLQASDVTRQTQDLDARITSLRTSVDRLLGLLEQASDTTDLIAIEGALSERQAELESLQTQRDFLSDQIDYSTLSVELYAEGTVAPGSPDDFWSAIVAGWNTLVAAGSGLLVVLGFALPWLIALAVIGAIVFAIVWSARKRRAAHVQPGDERGAV